MRKFKTLLIILIAVVGLPIFGISFLACYGSNSCYDGLSYMYALYLESGWLDANPKTKEELESYLALYSTREIDPQQSSWGSLHTLEPGERMEQYLLLWNAPLDVVYDRRDNIQVIYTSYE